MTDLLPLIVLHVGVSLLAELDAAELAEGEVAHVGVHGAGAVQGALGLPVVAARVPGAVPAGGAGAGAARRARLRHHARAARHAAVVRGLAEDAAGVEVLIHRLLQAKVPKLQIGSFQANYETEEPP